MRYFLFVILLISTVCLGQPPKNCEKIEVVTGLSTEDNYALVGKLLIAEGFEIEEANKDFMTIKSGTKSIRGTSYYLYFSFEKNKITISGKMRVTDMGMEFDTIRNKGMSGSPLKLAFQAMFDFANKLEGERLYLAP